MKAAVYVRDKEIGTLLFEGTIGMLFSGDIEIKSDRILRPFRLLGDGGNGLEINLRSDFPNHLQCIIERKQKNISFQFYMLEMGKERIQYVGNDISTGKFVSSPWVVRVKKLKN